MKLYHGTHNKSLNTTGTISEYGAFGEFLFFTDGEGRVPFGDTVFALDAESLSIASSYDIKYCDDYELIEERVNELAEDLGIDADLAFDLICEDEQWIDHAEEFDGDDQWAIQTARAEVAKLLGFDGVEVDDELGTSYMIAMLGRETSLELVA